MEILDSHFSPACMVTDFMTSTEKSITQRYSNCITWSHFLGLTQDQLYAEAQRIEFDASQNIRMINEFVGFQAEQGNYIAAKIGESVHRLGRLGIDEVFSYAFQVEVAGEPVTTSFTELSLVDHPRLFTGIKPAILPIADIPPNVSVQEQSALYMAPAVIAHPNQPFLRRAE